MEPRTGESNDELGGEPVLAVAAIRTPRGATLSLVGDLDLHGVRLLHERLAEIRSGEPVEQVEIDLGRLAFIDSSGLQAVLVAREDLQRDGIGTRIVSVSPAVSRVAEIAGLAEQFAVPDEGGDDNRDGDRDG
ncbi:MAG TPA: STAS domain-containing protein [Acidimicrobiales bacterium]